MYSLQGRSALQVPSSDTDGMLFVFVAVRTSSSVTCGYDRTQVQSAAQLKIRRTLDPTLSL